MVSPGQPVLVATTRLNTRTPSNVAAVSPAKTSLVRRELADRFEVLACKNSPQTQESTRKAGQLSVSRVLNMLYGKPVQDELGELPRSFWRLSHSQPDPRIARHIQTIGQILDFLNQLFQTGQLLGFQGGRFLGHLADQLANAKCGIFYSAQLLCRDQLRHLILLVGNFLPDVLQSGVLISSEWLRFFICVCQPGTGTGCAKDKKSK